MSEGLDDIHAPIRAFVAFVAECVCAACDADVDDAE